jgi:hypothetical protein
MSKLNQLQVSVVLKIKQIQNLKGDTSTVDQWAQIREEEFNAKLELLQSRNEGMDEIDIDREKEMMKFEEDWRGHKLVANLNSSILFTRT